MKKILILGKNGQIGWELQRCLSTLGHIVAVDRTEADLAEPANLVKLIRHVKPSIIVNAAAYTAVDQAEKEKELSHQINGESPGILAEEAKKLGSILVHYSTDYVFNGQAKTAYTEEDPTDPINAYGASKLAGEQAVRAIGGKYLIFRTSWIYASRGKNFLLTMLKLAKERSHLKIVQDQLGAPTWARLVAQATAQALFHPDDKWGTYHLTATGQTTWFQFAQQIFSTYARQNHNFSIPTVTGISTREYPTPARRPAFSVLDNRKFQRTFNLTLPSWGSMLELCIDELAPHSTVTDLAKLRG